MATQLQTINLAFAHLGEPIVADLGGDPKPPNLVKALAQWDQALDVALTTAPWLCATESRVIDAAVTPLQGDWRYSHHFECPKGTLKVWAVDGGHGFAWQAGTTVAEGGAVRRIVRADNAGPLRVDLIMRRRAEALTPLLADALAWELAMRLAGPIQASETKGRWCGERADQAYQKAAGAEASEIGGQAVLVTGGGLAWARAQAGAV